MRYKLSYQGSLDQHKAAEALSILNTLLEEVASRKKKQSDMVMDDSELPQNDNFIEGASFTNLFGRLLSRIQEVLASESEISKSTLLESQLLTQLLASASLIVAQNKAEVK